MRSYSNRWVCMDCQLRDADLVDTDSDIIACNICLKDYKQWMGPYLEEFGVTGYWYNIFLKEKGHWQQRHNSRFDALFEELFA